METYFNKRKKCEKQSVDMDLFPSTSTNEDNKIKREKRKRLKKKASQETKKIVEIVCKDENHTVYPRKPKRVRTAKVWFQIINKNQNDELPWNQLSQKEKEFYSKKEKGDRERYKKEYYQWKKDVLKIYQNQSK